LPLGFSRSIFPRRCHFQQSLFVFRAHRLRDADAFGFVFPVRLCFFHLGLLNPSVEENARKWNLVRSDFTNMTTVFGEQIALLAGGFRALPGSAIVRYMPLLSGVMPTKAKRHA